MKELYSSYKISKSLLKGDVGLNKNLQSKIVKEED